jgi:hypothetical protein
VLPAAPISVRPGLRSAATVNSVSGASSRKTSGDTPTNTPSAAAAVINTVPRTRSLRIFMVIAMR